mmetsp:Transcript_38728/g.124268  ORF Transcript_38728/g.124268 Transcript_38728/m.124268 type:complete len:233 (-) Transcript_38728:26-724(-)
MASASMWAFLIFTPPLVLRAYRMRRPELSVQAAAFTSILPTTNLDFPDVLTRPQTLRGWRVCCTVWSAVALVGHFILPHPDGADFEGLRAARFFTVWCFSGVTAFFALGAARRMEAVQEVTLFCTVAPPSLLTAAVFWLVIFPSLPPYLQRHAFRFDELTMHALSVPLLIADCTLLSPKQAAAPTANLWLWPVLFAAFYLPFHWAWLAAGGTPVYEFLRPSLPWAGAIHAGR